MLGCVAAVSATESPSQLSPALIQRMWIRVSSAAWAASRGDVDVMSHGFRGPAHHEGLRPLVIRRDRLSVHLRGMSRDYAPTGGLSRRR